MAPNRAAIKIKFGRWTEIFQQGLSGKYFSRLGIFLNLIIIYYLVIQYHNH